MKAILEKAKRIKVIHCVAALFLVCHFLLLLPLYQIAQYDIPSADDYASAITNKHYALYNDGFISWIQGCWARTVEAYQNSQGTYSTYFFCGPLNPTGQFEAYYFVVPIFLLTLFHASMFWMLYVALHKILNLRRSIVIMTYVIVSTLCIQLIPSAAEGLYWCSGALMYTGFFSVAMFATAELLLIIRAKGCKTLPVRIAGVSLLTFIIGGSNYPTAVAMLVILAYAAGYCLLYKRKASLRVLIPLCACAVGLLLSFLAPGNTARMEREGVSYHGTLTSALQLAFLLGFQWIRQWCTLPVIVGILMLIPIAAYGMMHTKHQFPLPFLWSVLSLIAFCALLTPTTYSYGWIGPARYMNIVFFGFVLMICSNVFYLTGWLMSRFRNTCEQHNMSYVTIMSSLFSPLKRYCFFIVAGLLIIARILLAPNFYSDERIPSQRNRYTSEQAYIDMRDGYAWRYHQTYLERIALLTDSETQDLLFEPYKNPPATLYFDDITEDPNDWRNQCVSVYFGKNSVALFPQQD